MMSVENKNIISTQIMKTTSSLIGFLLLVISFSVKSQQYDKLVVENAQWRVLYDDDATPWPDYMNGWLLRGDTIIDGFQYKKLYSRTFESPSSNLIVSQELYGFLREDTINKIVYALADQYMGCYDSINQEFVLFDFSYEIGDTSHLCSQNEDVGPCIVMDTGIINIYGTNRIIFYYDCGTCDFIEGIGHFQGLIESPVINISGGLTTSLIDYCVGTDEECNVLYVYLNEPSNQYQIKIYPNPCKGDFHILSKFQDIDKLKCLLTDINGKEIKYKIKSMLDHEIELHLFKPGIYILTVYQQDKLPSRYKIININF